MLTDTEKLNQIRAILEAPAAPSDRAFDRPQLPASQLQHKDGRTFNADGSLWTVDPRSQEPVCVAFGYISPAKTPELWDLARKVLSPDVLAEWEADWKANPFGVYRADVPDMLRRGQEVNLMLFSALLGKPFATFVQ